MSQACLSRMPLPMTAMVLIPALVSTTATVTSCRPYITLVDGQRPPVCDTCRPIDDECRPKRPSALFCFGPFFGWADDSLHLESDAIESVETEHVSQSNTSPDTDPSSGEQQLHVFKSRQQHPGLAVPHRNHSLSTTSHLVALHVPPCTLVVCERNRPVLFRDARGEGPHYVLQASGRLRFRMGVQGREKAGSMDDGN